MKEYKANSETIIEADSIEEALSIDTEMKDVNIILVSNVSTQGNWKDEKEQNHIPKEISEDPKNFAYLFGNWKDEKEQNHIPKEKSEDPKNFGKIIIRVGLGYHYLYDTLDKSWVKPVDTDTQSVIKKYLKEK